MTQFDPDGRDPGLSAERTDLAWSRSALSILGCGAVMLRGLARTPLPRANLALGIVVLVLGFAVWCLGSWNVSRTRKRGGRPSTMRELVPISVGVALVGIAAFVVSSVPR